MELVFQDKKLKKYLDQFTPGQLKILSNPKNYSGIASRKVDKICYYWERKIESLKRR
jgi:hypothetical protein